MDMWIFGPEYYSFRSKSGTGLKHNFVKMIKFDKCVPH